MHEIIFLKMGVKAMFDYFKKIKENYLSKNPRQKWEVIRNFSAKVTNVIGCNFMDSFFQITLRSYISAILLLYALLMVVYLFYYYRNEPFKMLQITSTFAIFIPVSFLLLPMIAIIRLDYRAKI